jgi:hypothetical protein
MSDTKNEKIIKWLSSNEIHFVKQCLLKKEMDPNEYLLVNKEDPKQYKQPLYYALYNGNDKMVRLLLELGANPNLTQLKAECKKECGCDPKMNHISCFEPFLFALLDHITTNPTDLVTEEMLHSYRKCFDLLVVFGFHRFAFDRAFYTGWLGINAFLPKREDVKNICTRIKDVIETLPLQVQNEQVQIEKDIQCLAFQYKTILFSCFSCDDISGIIYEYASDFRLQMAKKRVRENRMIAFI